jgi:hypothetical protein
LALSTLTCLPAFKILKSVPLIALRGLDGPCAHRTSPGLESLKAEEDSMHTYRAPPRPLAVHHALDV